MLSESEAAMLSDREIADLWAWAAAQDQGPETTQQHAFTRAVERAAYERAAALCDRFAERQMHPTECADAIRALGEQHD